MEILLKYFPNLTNNQVQKFQALQEVYTYWNEKINVISRKDIEHLYERHVLHSLGIAKIISFKPQTTIMDVGTGGGFPGIPLAILFPESNFLLIDSIGKKISVVREVAAALDLKNVSAVKSRAEDVEESFDFIVSRAVTRLAPFHQWVRGKFLKGGHNTLNNGILYLKGGDLEDELKELNLKSKTFELSDFFSEEYFLTKKVVYIPKV